MRAIMGEGGYHIDSRDVRKACSGDRRPAGLKLGGKGKGRQDEEEGSLFKCTKKSWKNFFLINKLYFLEQF